MAFAFIQTNTHTHTHTHHSAVPRIGSVVNDEESSSSSSETLVFRGRGHHHFFSPKVPERRHVKRHVREDHQVFTERKERVN